METKQSIPDPTIETFARSFFKEASAYGFKQVDYLRFVNLLLDFSMKNNGVNRPKVEEKTITNSNWDPQSSIKLNELPLIGERIKIRALEPEGDRKMFERWLQDAHGRYFLISRSTARIAHYDDLIKNGTSIVGIITLLDDTPAGAVAYLDYDRVQQKAELRKMIGETKLRGMGLAKEATRLWIDYGLNTLGLRKIYLNTLDTNIHNIKINEELGFKVEGILRNEVFFDGKYHDVLRMGLWKE